MRDPRYLIDKYCSRHPNFGIDRLMLYVSVGNAAFWVLGLVNPVLMTYLTFSPAAILRGQVWRLISFIFYPPSTGWLALIAIYFYYWIGSTLERYWGPGPFTVYFFTGVILTELYGFIIYAITGISYNLTAEYIYLSMFFSFAALFPDMQVLFMFIIPVKIKYLAYLDAAFFIFSVLVTKFPFNLLPVVAVANFIIFCGGDLRRSMPRRETKSALNFRRESARIRREQETRLYQHKCCVCGRTDADYPQLQFRYCSRCAGYHCFCEEHISNHIHFTE